MAVPCGSDNTGGQLFDTQKLALVDLYWSTNGPAWTDNWDAYKEPAASPGCDPSWAYIECDGDDVV
jgi:hypothetical protein